MLKADQAYVLKRKQEKKQAQAASAEEGPELMKNESSIVSSSDFLSVASNFTQQHAELTNELTVQA